MTWYYSPVLWGLLIFWILGGYHLSAWNTGNEGGLILKVVLMMGMLFMSILLIALDVFIRTRNWNQWTIIGLETVVLIVFWIAYLYLFKSN